MCYVENSVELATATCTMCSVMASLYQKPYPVCPHVPKMAVCRNRENHPRADYVYYRYAEIANFRGCGFCRWAERNPQLSPRELWDNPGWPGCCRPPTGNDYKQYVNGADWPAVSHIFKIKKSNRAGSGELGPPSSVQAGGPNGAQARASTPPSSSSSSGSPSSLFREELHPTRSRQSPRTKPSIVGPPRPNSPNRAGVRGDPIPRSSSPLTRGDARRVIERSTTPPISSSPSLQRDRSSVSVRMLASNGKKSSGSDEPNTPPGRSARELIAVVGPIPLSSPLSVKRSTLSGDSTSRIYSSGLGTSDKASPTRQRAALGLGDEPTPRRSPIVTVPSPARHTSLPIREDDDDEASPPPPPRRGETIIVQPPNRRGSPRLGHNAPSSNRQPPPSKAPAVPADDSSLTSEALHQVIKRFTTLGPSSSRNDPNHHSSSSSSSSDSSDATSVYSSRASDSGSGSTTTGGGSSDFTDFLSDDSDYELQRQAEERAAQLHQMRLERAEDREFRDAKRGLEGFRLNLEESAGAAGGMTVVGGRESGGVRGGGGPSVRAGPSTSRQQQLYIGRW